MKWIYPILWTVVAIVVAGCIAGVEVDVDTSVYVRVGGRIAEWINR